MATQSITQAEFDKYNTDRTISADNPMSKEVEWWANENKSAVGSIQVDKNDDEYMIGVLRKESDGSYEMDVTDMEMGIETLEEARKMLRERLES